MPKVTKPLTNTEINNARGKAKEYNLADGLGLALRVRPGGDKYWIFNYQRPITKVRANISLGIYPKVSLSSVRVIRSEYRDLHLSLRRQRQMCIRDSYRALKAQKDSSDIVKIHVLCNKKEESAVLLLHAKSY